MTARRSALEMSDRELRRHAVNVARSGRGSDTHLVHVNSRERAQMERMFGPASRNPHTGLPEHGFFSKLGKTANFMHKHVRKILKGGYDAMRGKGSIFGGTPLGTKLSNAVTGRHDKPITDQYGGATPEEKAKYKEAHGKDSLGYSSELHQAGSTIGSIYAGNAIGGAAGAAAKGAGASTALSTAASKAATMGANAAVKYGSKDMGTGDSALSGSGNRKDATKFLLGRATALADRPYTPYTGQRVAGLTSNEQQASALAARGNADVQSDLNNSRDAIRRSELEFNGENLDRYMNPYLDTAYKAQNDAYDRDKASLANSRSTAWGGDRSAFAASELDRVHKESLANISRDAYESASARFFEDANRQQRAADAWQQSAGNTANMNRQQIQDLMATGGLERVLNQANLDFDYQQFTEARDWDVNNLEPLIRTLSTTGAYTPKDKTSTTNAAIGAAASLAGAYFSAGGGGGGGGAGDVGNSFDAGSYASQAQAAGGS